MELNIICTTVSAEVILSFSTHSCVIPTAPMIHGSYGGAAQECTIAIIRKRRKDGIVDPVLPYSDSLTLFHSYKTN
jgi:hypothetical protein